MQNAATTVGTTEPGTGQASESDELVRSFAAYFQIVPAFTAELRKEVFQIRYQVYAEELGWEDTGNFPAGLERDSYDERSKHCLLRHIPTGEFIGCVRSVLPSAGGRTEKLPLEDSFGVDFVASHSLCEGLHRERVTEISRIAVLSSFRHRPGEKNRPNTDIETPQVDSKQERRRFPHIALGLYLAAGAMGIAEDMDAALAMMEPKLARRLRIFGIKFQQLADPIEHRGLRAPFLVSHDSFLCDLAPPMASLLRHIQTSIAE